MKANRGRLLFLMLGMLIGIGACLIVLALLIDKPAKNNEENHAKKNKTNIIQKPQAPAQKKAKPKSDNLSAQDDVRYTIISTREEDYFVYSPQDTVNENTEDIENETDNSQQIPLAYVGNEPEDDIAQDVLLETRYLSVRPYATAVISDADNDADSLESLEIAEEYYIKVEFWKSPINYRGYKLGSSTLILFGINQFDAVSLSEEEDGLHLQYLGKRYLLQKSDQFTALELKK